MSDTNRAEFEGHIKCKFPHSWQLDLHINIHGEYVSMQIQAMFEAWQAARANSIESQLDHGTLKKMIFLAERKMKPVGVVMLADDGKRATIDMGRVTWTGQKPERVALSDAEIDAIAMKHYGSAATAQEFAFSRDIRSAQADIGRAISKAGLGNTEVSPELICPKCGVDRFAERCASRGDCEMIGVAQADGPVIDYGTKNTTQPVIAEAARDDVVKDTKDARIKQLESVIKNALSWIEIRHRPPVSDRIECGRMVLIRLHALADLDAAISTNAPKDPA